MEVSWNFGGFDFNAISWGLLVIQGDINGI